jgi:hypothetical protein
LHEREQLSEKAGGGGGTIEFRKEDQLVEVYNRSLNITYIRKRFALGVGVGQTGPPGKKRQHMFDERKSLLQSSV